MCGIVVVIGRNSKEVTEKSLDKIVHRGGDAYTILTIGEMSMGFTRLAINDQSPKGEQPFSFDNYIGLFNAEIYNHKRLTKKHHLKPIGKSDSEVILPLYQKFKENTLELLDGFFAGLIYDKKENQIVLLRDYIGKKPLFFAYDKERQYIVSELKALPKIEYFEAIPKGISRLENKKIHLIKEHTNIYKNREKNLIKESIYRAVEKRVIGIENMQFGVFLSGGLDSSIVAMIISRLVLSSKVKYYCIADQKSKDLKYINIMKNFLKIDDAISYVDLPHDRELQEVIKEVVYATESINPSIVSNGIGAYLLSKRAKQDGIKVVITGDGADEIFMGYQDREVINKLSDWKKLQKDFIDDLHLTELRRVDLACMANSVEIRCPFLDKKVYEIALNLKYKDFFGLNQDSLNKNILRDIFKDELPEEIINRKKVSFDVGSGLQKIVIRLCTKENLTEIEYLRNIWNQFFGKNLSKVNKNPYFWSYPQFNSVILKRGEKYL
jgi:asparagine synthase (glutamine-hydrolysing)